MEQIQRNQTKCNYCGQIFSSKGKYQVHYNHIHKIEVKINDKISIQRSEDGKFLCICGKGFQVTKSLLQHQKSCQAFQNELENQELISESEESHQGKCF